MAPSVLESIKEGFSFQPKVRSPRRLNSSPHTPVRYPCQVGGGGTAGKLPPPHPPHPPSALCSPVKFSPFEPFRPAEPMELGLGGGTPPEGTAPLPIASAKKTRGGRGRPPR